MAKITIEFKDAEDIAMAVPLLLALSLCPAIPAIQNASSKLFMQLSKDLLFSLYQTYIKNQLF